MEPEAMAAWLQCWPGWKQGTKLYVDHTDTVPGNCGLFPGGAEEVGRMTDVLGNVTVLCRERFTLYRTAEETEDGGENASWVHELQGWIGRQSIRGLAPVFGDDPRRSVIRAEKGRLYKSRQTGCTLYAVDITAEFIKYYEVNE